MNGSDKWFIASVSFNTSQANTLNSHFSHLQRQAVRQLSIQIVPVGEVRQQLYGPLLREVGVKEDRIALGVAWRCGQAL